MPLESPQVIFQPPTEFRMMDSLLKKFSLILALFTPVYTAIQPCTLPYFHMHILLKQQQEKNMLYLKGLMFFSSFWDWAPSPWLISPFVYLQPRIAGNAVWKRLYLSCVLSFRLILSSSSGCAVIDSTLEVSFHCQHNMPANFLQFTYILIAVLPIWTPSHVKEKDRLEIIFQR